MIFLDGFESVNVAGRKCDDQGCQGTCHTCDDLRQCRNAIHIKKSFRR